MAVYSKERPELELESFFRSLYPSTRRGIRENWMRLREDPEISQWEIGKSTGYGYGCTAGAGGTEAGLGAVVQRAAGPVEIPAEGVDAALLSPDRRNVPDGGAGRHAEGGRRGTVFRGHGQVGRDVPGGSERTERAALEGNGAQGVEQKLLRAIERQNGGLTPEAEAWARSLPSARQEAAWQQLTLDAFKAILRPI